VITSASPTSEQRHRTTEERAFGETKMEIFRSACLLASPAGKENRGAWCFPARTVPEVQACPDHLGEPVSDNPPEVC